MTAIILLTKFDSMGGYCTFSVVLIPELQLYCTLQSPVIVVKH